MWSCGMEILFLGLGGFLLSYNIVYWIFRVVFWDLVRARDGGWWDAGMTFIKISPPEYYS